MNKGEKQTLSKIIVLKTTTKNFEDILVYLKRFEVLKENYKIEVGDTIVFCEYDKFDDITHREIHAVVTHITCPAAFHDKMIVGFSFCLFYPESTHTEVFCL